MKKPTQCATIDEIRKCIDQLDNGIIKLMGERFKFVQEIVKYKTDETSVIAKDRYKQVIENRRSLAIKNGLNPDIIENVYHTLIDYFIAEELKILKNNNI